MEFIVSTYTTDGLTVDEMELIVADFQSKLAKARDLEDRLLDGTEPAMPTDVPLEKKRRKGLSKKKAKALKKKQAKQEKKAKQAKKALKAKKAKKGKAKKGKRKKKSGWGIAATGAAIGGGLIKARKSIARGARRLARGSRSVGRRMWASTIGAGKWLWSKTGWAGRKLAGAGSWVLQGGSRLVRWGLGTIGWGWAIIGAAGLIAIGLVAWGVAASSETIAAPLAWLAKGRPGSLKKFKAARRAKLAKKSKLSKKELRKLRKAHQKRADEISKELEKAQSRSGKSKSPAKPKVASKKQVTETTVETPTTETKVTETKATEVKTQVKAPIKKARPKPPKTAAFVKPEDREAHKAVTAEENELIRKAGAQDYTGLTLEQIVEGLNLRMLKLKQDGVPKEAFSRAAGRYYKADALMMGNPLGGSALYQDVKANILKGYGGADATSQERLKLAREDFHWTKFQEGMVEEEKLLERYVPADSGV